MLALSIRQPYASLIVNGIKDVENRSWNTQYRGWFVVHAGKTPERRHLDNLSNLPERMDLQVYDDYHRLGGFVGLAYLQLVLTPPAAKFYTRDHLLSRWWQKENYGFQISQVLRFNKIIPYKGQLGFFKFDRATQELIDQEAVFRPIQKLETKYLENREILTSNLF